MKLEFHRCLHKNAGDYTLKKFFAQSCLIKPINFQRSSLFIFFSYHGAIFGFYYWRKI